MNAPRLLDLFCCAGGAGVGYHRAGFDVVGVDISPQPNYPFKGIACDHKRFSEPRYWTGWRPKGEKRLSTVVQVYGNAGGKREWPAAMGIDWATYDEIAEAIPPAYTEHIGTQVLAHIGSPGDPSANRAFECECDTLLSCPVNHDRESA